MGRAPYRVSGAGRIELKRRSIGCVAEEGDHRRANQPGLGCSNFGSPIGRNGATWVVALVRPQ
jgi:hypothetical protein